MTGISMAGSVPPGSVIETVRFAVPGSYGSGAEFAQYWGAVDHARAEWEKHADSRASLAEYSTPGEIDARSWVTVDVRWYIRYPNPTPGSTVGMDTVAERHRIPAQPGPHEDASRDRAARQLAEAGLVRVGTLHEQCSFQVRNFYRGGSAASDNCRRPADTVVIVGSPWKLGNRLWRCPDHRGQVSHAELGVTDFYTARPAG